MNRILLLSLLLAAGEAPAMSAAAKPASPAATVPAITSQRFPGVSEAGNAVLAKARSTPDPQLQALARQQRVAQEQLTTAVMAPVIDVDKVTAALLQGEAVQAQIRTHNTGRLLSVLKQMPAEDRGTFLRTLVMARTNRGAGAAASTPAATPQP